MPSQFNGIVQDLIRLSAWFVLLAVIFIPLERVIPRSPQAIIRKNYLEDCFYYFLNGIVPKLILVAPLSILAAFIHHLGSNDFYAAVDGLSIRKRLILALVIGDFGAYWGHRWSHQIPFLWRFHSVHHSATELDWLVNSRAHPIDMVFTRLCGLIPIYFLGLAQPTANTADIVPFVYVIFGNFWSFVIHANINLRFGWFEKLLATPAFHHWHHTNEDASLMNKNFAAIFPVYDRLFGSHFLPKQRWPASYGLAEAVAESSPESSLVPKSLSSL